MAEGGLPKTDDNDPYHLYTITKRSSSSITIRFESQDIYSNFERIIFQQYDEKKCAKKGKGGQNGIQYKRKSEPVTITLYKSTSTLLIQGTGCQQWFGGEFLKFAKQLRIENPHSPTSTASCQHEGQRQQIQQQPPYSQEQPISNVTSQPSASMTSQQQENPIDLQLTTYKTPAVTGSETLVSIEEFKSIFAIPYKYRDKTEPWPRTATLLYKYSSNANTKYEDIPENTWKRIDNDPKIGDYKGEHAESIMIKQLMEIQNHLKKQKDYNRGSYKGIHTIDVILSYSPCNLHPHCCSTKLCDFKASLENDIRSAVDSSNGTTVETADDLNKKMSNLNMEGKEKEVAEKMPNSNIEGKEKEGAKIEMNIQFSNFYVDDDLKNREGLKNLQQKGIKLDVLTGDKWIYLYRAIGFELPEGREEREKDDEAKFKELI